MTVRAEARSDKFFHKVALGVLLRITMPYHPMPAMTIAGAACALQIWLGERIARARPRAMCVARRRHRSLLSCRRTWLSALDYLTENLTEKPETRNPVVPAGSRSFALVRGGSGLGFMLIDCFDQREHWTEHWTEH
ncbi:MAG: hypothetical protein M1840_003507 [Geoglossum simile]|nr:MAG: hypothetical protein M1840_003507 [Geoglossum simile]